MAEKRAQRRILMRIAGVFAGVLLLGGFVYFVHAMMIAKSTKPDRKVQVVQIMRPPPPPPPPDEPPPPPPPEKTEEVQKEEPEPQPEDQPAPVQNLGLDAEGSAGGDAFGLAARHGGSDLIGGSGSAPFAWYTNRISDAIRDRLASAACAKSAKSSMSIRVIMEADGRVKQIKLSSTTGNSKTDECIDSTLASIQRISDPVPPGMPEQVNLKIVPRI